MTARMRGGAVALVLLAAAAAAACGREGVTPTATGTLADTADMVMYGMERGVFEDGIKRAWIVADTAYTYQNTQIMEFRGLRVTFFDRTGAQTSVLTAGEGTYRIQLESLDARRAVRVVTTDNKRLSSEFLAYDRTANLVRTDSAFTYESGTEYVEGNGFVSDPEFRNVTIQQPRGRQRGEGMLLPGQRP